MRRCLIYLGLVVIFLQACLPIAIQPAQITPAPANIPEATPTAKAPTSVTSTALASPTTTPLTPSITPTATRTKAASTPTATLTPCMKAGGTVDVFEFTTILLPDPLVYRIYLPPCYEEQPERAYPVLYLIHGQTYSDTQWDRLGVPETADRLIAAGELAPFIVVMPRDRVWLEPTKDHFGLAVEQSLIPWIDAHYRTLPERDYRAIGGLSRGGAWAAHIGFSHPELFSAVGMHSGFIFHTDVNEIYAWFNNMPEGQAFRVYMDIADKDRPEITESATWLEGLLTQFGIVHEWHMFTGEHEEEYWKAHVEEYLRWYCQDWKK